MSDNENETCPKCGHAMIYKGLDAIECGWDENCPNYTEKQASEVARVLAEKFPSASEVSPEEEDPLEEMNEQLQNLGADVSDLDYDDDSDTDPLWGPGGLGNPWRI